MNITVRPRVGAFAGMEVFTDRDGRGVFTCRVDGSHLQHYGTGQTPRFTTGRQFAAWLRVHFLDDTPRERRGGG